MARKKNIQLNRNNKMLVTVTLLSVAALVLVVVVVLLTTQSRETGVERPGATADPKLSYQPTQEELERLDQAVKQAYIDEKGPTEKPLAIVYYGQEGFWAGGRVGEERSQFVFSFLAELRDGVWIAGVAGSEEFFELARRAPDKIVPQSLKEAYERDRKKYTSE